MDRREAATASFLKRTVALSPSSSIKSPGFQRSPTSRDFRRKATLASGRRQVSRHLDTHPRAPSREHSPKAQRLLDHALRSARLGLGGVPPRIVWGDHIRVVIRPLCRTKTYQKRPRAASRRCKFATNRRFRVALWKQSEGTGQGRRGVSARELSKKVGGTGWKPVPPKKRLQSECLINGRARYKAGNRQECPPPRLGDTGVTS